MRKEWKRTRNPYLKVIWMQDATAPPGFGTLLLHITLTGKRYALARVPKRIYMELLRRPDPEVSVNQLLTMYIPAE